METKSDRILTSVKFSFLLPLPCEINVFTVQDPSKNGANLFKKRLCNQTLPKSLIFNLRAPLDGNMNRKGFQKGFLLGRPGAPKIQKSSSKRKPKCGREPIPQKGPNFSPNGCQNIFPKQYNLAQILSKEVSRNVLNEINSGK